MLESAQIRAARALLGWHQEQLAKRAKIGLATIQRLERAPPGPVMAHVATVMKIIGSSTKQESLLLTSIVQAARASGSSKPEKVTDSVTSVLKAGVYRH